MNLESLAGRQPDPGAGEQQTRHGPALSPFEPYRRIARRQARLQLRLFFGADRSRLHRPALHASHGNRRNQRTRHDRSVGLERDIEKRTRLRRIGPPSDAHPQAMSGRRDAQCLQHRADGELARPAIEVVHAVLTGIEPVHDDMVGSGDFKPPRLRVVSARRPSREVEDLFDYRHGAGQRRNCRRAITSIRRWMRLALPLGRHVWTSLWV